jgi:C4-dicarboxylate-binding protein DctP
MRLNRQTICALALSLMAFTPLAAIAPASAQTRIIMSNDNSELGLKGQTFEFLKKDLEKRLGDKVSIELHHSGTLFNQGTQIQGVQLGSAHLIAPGQGIFASLASNINLLSIPFLLSSPQAIEAAINDPDIGKTFLPELESKNLKVVGVWMNGPRDISTKADKPILVPGDMKGLKIRVQPAPVDIKTMQTFGANVVTIDWTEVSTALQQGVIDAVEPTPNALIGAGLQDLIGQTSKVGYRFDFYLVTTNKKWWDGLPEDVRKAFEQSMKEATAWNWENTDKANAEAYKKVIAAGKKVYDLTPEQRKQWVDAVQPLWKKYGTDVVGEDVMKKIEKIDADSH